MGRIRPRIFSHSQRLEQVIWFIEIQIRPAYSNFGYRGFSPSSTHDDRRTYLAFFYTMLPTNDG